MIPLLVLLLLFQPACGENKTVSEQLKVQAGKTLIITLEANHTTGYHWELAKPLDSKIIKLEGSVYNRPKKRIFIGAGGSEEWTFKALKVGQAKIYFKYVRPWEKDIPPVRTRNFTVSIEGEKKRPPSASPPQREKS